MDDEYIKAPSGATYHRGDLRLLAYDWHGGQSSALYAFASSGTPLSGLASEARQCVGLTDDPIEADKLHAIASLEPRTEG
jgi:hypothetical protein